MNVIIIGGGAAGCFAAVLLAENGIPVTLLERSEPLHKLLLTGKGRCNLTNLGNSGEAEEFIRNVFTNGKFLYSALAAFPPRDCADFFERLGIPLKTERGRRVFPLSDKSADVKAALLSRIRTLGVSVIKANVVSIDTAGSETAEVAGVTSAGGRKIPADKVLLAAGGASYPKTGSDGSGFALAAAVGHKIVPPKAALVGITCETDYSGEGYLLKNTELSLFCGKKLLYKETGEVELTEYGLRGALALTASCYVKDGGGYVITLDLKPKVSAERIEREVRQLTEQRGSYESALRKLLPKEFVPLAIRQKSVKRLVFPVNGLLPVDEAIITDGGVDVREIDPRSMQSKITKGLFFAGEVIDVAAFTGGYNLHIAFSTAFTAVKGICNDI